MNEESERISAKKGRNEDRKLKNVLKKAEGKVKKECLESTFDKITELKKKTKL